MVPELFREASKGWLQVRRKNTNIYGRCGIDRSLAAVNISISIIPFSMMAFRMSYQKSLIENSTIIQADSLIQ